MEGRFCHKCGSELAADARFCSKCGAPLTGAKGGSPMVKKALKNTGITVWIIRIGLVLLIISFFLPLATMDLSLFGQAKTSTASMFTMVDKIQQTLDYFGTKPKITTYIRLYSFWLIPIFAFISMFITISPTRGSLLLIIILLFIPLIVIVASIGTIGDLSKLITSDDTLAKIARGTFKNTLKSMHVAPSLGAYCYAGGFLATLIFSIAGIFRVGRSTG